MRILISGASGLVGSSLIPFLKGKGHTLLRLVRSLSQKQEESILWDFQKPFSNLSAFEDLDAVIHLAGEAVATGRWSVEKKSRIRHSRVDSSRFLSEAFLKLKRPPKFFLCASATGFYGSRGEEKVDEKSLPGVGFLSEVCQEWERACDPAREKGIRVVHLRFGILLSEKGGALKKMLLPFKMGLGGVVGDGKQWMSWMSLADTIRGIDFVLNHEAIRGPVNFVSPHPVTNREWTQVFGKVLHRPTIFKMPAFAVKMAFGEMGEAVLLASTRVEPKVLQEEGFQFQDRELEGTLKRILNQPNSSKTSSQ